jgi:hypothetical protein
MQARCLSCHGSDSFEINMRAALYAYGSIR